MDEQRRTKNKEKNSSVNWWKWAFLGLILVLILFFVQLMGSFQSVLINKPNDTEVAYTDQEMVFTTSTNREDTEQFINTFLTTALDEEDNHFYVELKDQLLVHGQLEVFQLNVPFTLAFDPYVLENGNVQLRADSVELGTFSLPVGATMSLFANQLKVPDFIAIDSEKEMIVINLNELETEQNIGIQMVRIDLPEDEIQMNLIRMIIASGVERILCMEKALFAGGCFWCMVQPFDTLSGIQSVVSGYAGGHIENPTYEQVKSQKSGHTEVVQITFDPSIITFDELVTIYWQVTDPTDAFGQFMDRGASYRPVIYYYSHQQKEVAKQS